MKKTAIFLALTATAILLGGCYLPPPPYQSGVVVRPAAARAYHHPGAYRHSVYRPVYRQPVYRQPVMVPAPMIIPLPPPVYYYR
ncbi:MAG: hypothetical protein D3914_03005 [Candidatus Electrothrix sp. LOE2]|nr:hypothetical protein [Candidatus Electrothrix sp. LOE2]